MWATNLICSRMVKTLKKSTEMQKIWKLMEHNTLKKTQWMSRKKLKEEELNWMISTWRIKLKKKPQKVSRAMVLKRILHRLSSQSTLLWLLEPSSSWSSLLKAALIKLSLKVEQKQNKKMLNHHQVTLLSKSLMLLTKGK